MKLQVAGTVKRLNVEHRTSNIEHRILMTLRFIYLIKNERTAACNEFPSTCSGLSLSMAAESNFEG